MFEVLSRPIDVVGLERTAVAARLPIGMKHQMMDDELTASVEQVSERQLALRRGEDIDLLDLDPGQSAPLGAQAVARPHVLLLLDQKRLTRSEPFVLRDDLREFHRSPRVCVLGSFRGLLSARSISSRAVRSGVTSSGRRC
jgi:hypothetical protein